MEKITTVHLSENDRSSVYRLLTELHLRDSGRLAGLFYREDAPSEKEMQDAFMDSITKGLSKEIKDSIDAERFKEWISIASKRKEK